MPYSLPYHLSLVLSLSLSLPVSVRSIRISWTVIIDPHYVDMNNFEWTSVYNNDNDDDDDAGVLSICDAYIPRPISTSLFQHYH